jgi:hypothetical protein
MGAIGAFFWDLTSLQKAQILSVYAAVVSFISAYFFSVFLRQNSSADRLLRRQTLSSSSSDQRDLFAPRVAFYCLLLLGTLDYLLYYGSVLYSHRFNFDPAFYPSPCTGPVLWFVNCFIGTAGYLVDAALLLLLDYLFAETLNAAVLPGRTAQLKLEKRLRFTGRFVVAAFYSCFYLVWVRDLVNGYLETPEPFRSRGCIDRNAITSPLGAASERWAHRSQLCYLAVSFGVLFARNVVAARDAARYQSTMYLVRSATIRRLRFLTVGNVSALAVISAFAGFVGPSDTAVLFMPYNLTSLIKNGATISYYALNSVAFCKLKAARTPPQTPSPFFSRSGATACPPTLVKDPACL